MVEFTALEHGLQVAPLCPDAFWWRDGDRTRLSPLHPKGVRGLDLPVAFVDVVERLRRRVGPRSGG